MSKPCPTKPLSAPPAHLLLDDHPGLRTPVPSPRLQVEAVLVAAEETADEIAQLGPKRVPCPACDGSGRRRPWGGPGVLCSGCDGLGSVTEARRDQIGRLPPSWWL